MHLPIPKLIVFYNGLDKKEDTVLKLSDAFAPENKDERCSSQAGYDIEVKVRMININYGHSQSIMEKCSTLAEYAWLIENIRKNGAGMEVEEAVDKAIDDMPNQFLIRKYLVANRAEVKNMCITEYNEAETMQMLKEEAERMAEEKAEKRVEEAEKRAEKRVEEAKKEAEKRVEEAEKRAEEAEEKFEKLIVFLLADGRTEEVKKAVSDKAARAEMYRKYGIT